MRISFSDAHGRPLPSYEAEIDWNTVAGDVLEIHGLHEVVLRLEEIASTMKKWTEPALYGSRLQVVSRDGDEIDRERARQLAERRETTGAGQPRSTDPRATPSSDR